MTVCDMLDLMLPKGPIVFTEDKGGHKEQIDSDEEHKFEKPMAVLTNGNSASASEICRSHSGLWNWRDCGNDDLWKGRSSAGFC